MTRTKIGVLGVVFCISALSLMPLASAASSNDDADHAGIWKYYVPTNAKGELDNYDPIGLIAGALIKTDCSYNWRDDDGKMYCFATPTSLVYFEDWPKTYIARATDALQRLKPGS